MARNYREEYDEYHGTRKQKDARNNRNKARRQVGLKSGDSQEVDHKDGNPNNNSKSNLRAVSRKTNREKGAEPMATPLRTQPPATDEEQGVDPGDDEESDTDTPSPSEEHSRGHGRVPPGADTDADVDEELSASMREGPGIFQHEMFKDSSDTVFDLLSKVLDSSPTEEEEGLGRYLEGERTYEQRDEEFSGESRRFPGFYRQPGSRPHTQEEEDAYFKWRNQSREERLADPAWGLSDVDRDRSKERRRLVERIRSEMAEGKQEVEQ